jgi:hypothetical protein
MIVDIRSPYSVFITIGTETYYIDNSTGEHLMEHWETDPEHTQPLY